MSFAQLKESIKAAALAKSQAGEVDAGKIQAAAADGAAAGGENTNGGEGGNGKTDDATQGAGEGQGSGEGAGAGSSGAAAAGEGENDELGKSFTLVLEDGTEVEALDASKELLRLRSQVAELTKSMGGVNGTLKSYEADASEIMTSAIDLIKSQGEALAAMQTTIKEQGEQLAKSLETIGSQDATIQSLRTDLDAVRNEPAGRKSVTNPGEVRAESPMAKSLQNDAGTGLGPQEFLAKCLSLQKAGRLTLQDCAMAEAAIGSNVPVPPAIVSKVYSE